MKKLCFILFVLLSVTSFGQETWTVRSVPNTRLQGNDIHVSDPDGYLSDSVEMTINTALNAIRDKADVFVVTLTSIGDADPRHFATELFNYWGIGDAETNNGVLLLFVEDQHALETETGYGAEETLTDAKCERIFSKTIVPFFKAGDYEGGLCAGVGEIVAVYGGEVPDGLKTTLPEGGDSDGGTVEKTDFGEMALFGSLGLLLLFLPFCGIIFWAAKSKTKAIDSDDYKTFEEAGATYVEGLKTSWSGSPWDGRGCLGAMTIGLSVFLIMFIIAFVVVMVLPDASIKRQCLWVLLGTLFVYLTWVCFRHNHRVLKIAKKLSKSSINPKSVYKAALDHGANKAAMLMAPWLGWIYYVILKKKMQRSEACVCPKCNSTMEAFPEYRLPQAHEVENRLGALDYQSYRCLHGHVVVVKEHGSQYGEFSTSEKCGAYTLKQTETKTLKQATYEQAGEKMESYECQHCGETLMKMVVIPQLIHYSSSSGSSSGSRSSSHSSYHSSHSSHRSGSFGGGRSGGGGHSGRW